MGLRLKFIDASQGTSRSQAVLLDNLLTLPYHYHLPKGSCLSGMYEVFTPEK